MITNFRAILLVILAGLAILVAAPAAWATTDVGTQNPQFTVRASAASDGIDPDRATVGDTVTVTGSATNNTAVARTPRVTVVLEDPQGRTIFTASERVRIAPHQTARRSFSYVVDPGYPKGVYELTVSATNAKGTSSATAELEIY